MITPANPTLSGTPATAALATSARHRLLAWPRYERAVDLDALTRLLGPDFGERADVCLCLRHDPAVDVALDDAIAAVAAALTQAFGPDPRFEVLMVDNPLDAVAWSALGQALTGVISLPWSWDAPRRDALNVLGHPLLTTHDELVENLAAARPIAGPALARRQPGSSLAIASAGTAVTGGPTISILLRTFDRPQSLRGALASLAEQTFRDFEVVVVNDGAAGLESLVLALAPGMAVTYLRPEPSAVGATGPHPGLAVARGQYVATLDDQQRYPPDHLATLLAAQRSPRP